MAVNAEVVLRGDAGLDRRQVALLELLHTPALCAHQVVMMVVAAQPVCRLALVSADLVEQSGRRQRQERPIHRRQPELRTVVARPAEDLLRGERVPVTQRAKHRHPLWRAADPAVLEGVSDVHSGSVVRRAPPTDVGSRQAARLGAVFGRALPEMPLVRVLLGVVGILALVTAVGLVALWPRGESAAQFGQLGLPTERAEITAVGAQCVTIPTQPCQRLDARLTDGARAGETTSFDFTETVDIDVGDVVRLAPTGAPGSTIGGGPPVDAFAFSDFERRVPMGWLAAIFALVIIATTRLRGARALVALTVSLGLVVVFIVPSIVRGNEPLLVAIVGAFAIVLITIPLAYGIGVKSLAAIIGTATSLVITVVLAELATSATHLTGRASEEALFLRAATDEISIVGLVIAGMVIGALGVLDDLTVSQASTVMALRRANPALGFRQLFRGALTVGNDHILATVNTLVLAYAGAALPTLLIFSASNTEFGSALNSEVVAADVVSMLVGSIGLIAAVPVTTAIAAALAGRLDPEEIDVLEDQHHDHHHH